MKRTVFLGLVVLYFIGACTQEKKSPIEGEWKLVYASYPSDNLTYPVNITGEGVKSWTSGSFVFAGKYQIDTATFDNYGWGTYKLTEGKKYEESILYHHLMESSKGTTIKMIIEVRNDTLIQKWPAEDNWQLPEKFSIEKYVRLR